MASKLSLKLVRETCKECGIPVVPPSKLALKQLLIVHFGQQLVKLNKVKLDKEVDIHVSKANVRFCRCILFI